MVLSSEESARIKKQLLEQLSNFPENKRDQIKSAIESMAPDQLENFVNENNLSHLGGNCIFCSIIQGNTPSYKIAESQNHVAILEINPLSKGHTLIVPKQHTQELDEETKEITKQMADLLKKKFSPEEIKINPLEIMGHKLLEIVPIFGDEKERSKASDDYLIQVQNQIINEPEISPPKIEKEKNEKPKEIPKLPPKIP